MNLYNVGTADADASLRFACKTERAVKTDLLGREKEALVCDPEIRFTVGAHKIFPAFVETVHARTAETSADVQLLSGETFELPKDLQTPFPENVTENDYLAEKKREAEIEKLFHRAKAEWETMQQHAAETPAEKAQHAACETRFHSAHRTWLESRLSVLYTEMKRTETLYGSGSTEAERLAEKQQAILRKIAYELNQARVRKRAAEYVQDFFEAAAREEGAGSKRS